MRLGDTATMHAPASEVWTALTDPAVLAATIPGCDRLEPTRPGRWRFTLTAGVASLHGTFTGEATVTERQEQRSVAVSAHGAGGPGTVTASVRIALTSRADGTTDLSYDADAAFDGQLASVGHRMLASAATRLARQFLTALDQILTRNGAVSPGPAQAAGPSGLQPVTDSAARSFVPGVLAGAAAGAVAGFVAARLIARRAR